MKLQLRKEFRRQDRAKARKEVRAQLAAKAEVERAKAVEESKLSLSSNFNLLGELDAAEEEKENLAEASAVENDEKEFDRDLEDAIEVEERLNAGVEGYGYAVDANGKSVLVKPGMVLVAVDGRDVAELSFVDALTCVRKAMMRGDCYITFGQYKPRFEGIVSVRLRRNFGKMGVLLKPAHRTENIGARISGFPDEPGQVNHPALMGTTQSGEVLVGMHILTIDGRDYSERPYPELKDAIRTRGDKKVTFGFHVGQQDAVRAVQARMRGHWSRQKQQQKIVSRFLVKQSDVVNELCDFYAIADKDGQASGDSACHTLRAHVKAAHDRIADLLRLLAAQEKERESKNGNIQENERNTAKGRDGGHTGCFTVETKRERELRKLLVHPLRRVEEAMREMLRESRDETEPRVRQSRYSLSRAEKIVSEAAAKSKAAAKEREAIKKKKRQAEKARRLRIRQKEIEKQRMQDEADWDPLSMKREMHIYGLVSSDSDASYYSYSEDGDYERSRSRRHDREVARESLARGDHSYYTSSDEEWGNAAPSPQVIVGAGAGAGASAGAGAGASAGAGKSNARVMPPSPVSRAGAGAALRKRSVRRMSPEQGESEQGI